MYLDVESLGHPVPQLAILKPRRVRDAKAQQRTARTLTGGDLDLARRSDPKTARGRRRQNHPREGFFCSILFSSDLWIHIPSEKVIEDYIGLFHDYFCRRQEGQSCRTRVPVVLPGLRKKSQRLGLVIHGLNEQAALTLS